MKNIYIITILLTLSSMVVFGQETNSVQNNPSIKKIELKPNSREYGANLRDNQRMRTSVHHDQAKFQYKRPVNMDIKVKQRQKASLAQKQNLRRNQQLRQQQQQINRQRRVNRR